MQRLFAHAIVSMLLVSLMLSGCYSSRDLRVLASRDVHTIEQARYDELWATPHEQLSEAEFAERDSLQLTQLRRVLIREATENEFNRQLLIQRDSIIIDQARYRVLMSTTGPSQAEAAELEILRHNEDSRNHALGSIESNLQRLGLLAAVDSDNASKGVVVGVAVGVAVVAAIVMMSGFSNFQVGW